MIKDGKRGCNCCGKLFVMSGELYQEDFLQIEKAWGYFSNQDGQDLTMDICEECLMEWIKTFRVQPQITERTII